MLLRRIAVLAMWCAATSAFAQQPRDGRSVTGTGTARISGVVTSDEAQPKRLRRARVTLTGARLTAARTVIANDDGTFTFEGLAAGRYTMAAAKEGYITLNFGAKRPGHAGVPVTVKDGEARRLTIRIPRGGVISGTVTDQDGTPVAGITVNAATHRFSWTTGDRRLTQAGISGAGTDDRGVYRIYGLPAGEYLVSAQIRSAAAMTGDLRVLSDADVRRALAEVKGRPAFQAATRPGIPAAPPSQVASAPAEPEKRVAYASVFYPGTPVLAQARGVTIEKGQERTAIDFQLEYVPTATIDGMLVSVGTVRSATVVLVASSSLSAGPDAITRSAQPAPDGYFRFTGVPPGQYMLTARIVPAPDPSAGRAASAPLFATTDVSVTGADIAGVVLSPQPGITIRGRVVFEGTTPLPASELAIFSSGLGLPLTTGQPGAIAPPLLAVESGGRFTIHGIPPGPLRSLGTRGLRTPIGPWWLQSVAVDGRDVLDAPLEFRQSTDEAVVTLSDRASELSGTVTDPLAQPASGHFLLVFGTDRTSWFPGSRRVAAVRPDAAGRYAIRNLPAGDYFVVATDEVDQGQWFDVDMLQDLTRHAAKIRLAEYERKTHNVVTGGR